jgi:hypothetical protein
LSKINILALNAKYNRILEATKFNGRQLFGDSATDIVLQAGFGQRGQLALLLSQGLLARTTGNGTFAAAVAMRSSTCTWAMETALFRPCKASPA